MLNQIVNSPFGRKPLQQSLSFPFFYLFFFSFFLNKIRRGFPEDRNVDLLLSYYDLLKN